ncbi:hypothetical protein [Flavobacterium caseinilyticum]|uniref:Uncharacterized protein n=1 Tax=Flavobacterium caseinilyticum TaxID=2541732 RepID=A0A4R5ATX7_9FLAO|nr:hypothetical protein [Flavobacterium caseinilyticum]TDD75146.1 hypothetical protein E0F89_12225 [Flavobacterium caseinilyticum]
MGNNKTQKIHFLYIIGILIMIIICLFTFNFGDQIELVAYISFALTITSLFLALISIIYAFYSNMSLSQTLSQLNSASNKVDESSNKLTESTIKLNQQIENIPVLLKSLEGKVDNTHKLVSDVYNKEIIPKDASTTVISKEIFDKFYKFSSPSGLLALYATYLSFKTKKKFSLSELEYSTSLIKKDYTNGFLVACSSFSFFTRKDYSEDWVIPNFNEDVSENIKSELEKRISEMDEEDREYLTHEKKLIEDFFED